MGHNETRTLWISVALALMAMFLFYSYTQEMKGELTKNLVNENVVIAKEDINEMETIDITRLEVVTRPSKYIDPSALKDANDAAGKVALVPIKKGEQLLESKIMEPGPATGLSLQVAPSKRAVSIPVDEVRGVSKLLKPGDRIDIIASVEVGKGANQRREVKTIMQDVVVLATGLRIANELPRLYERVGREDYIRSLRSDTSFNAITIEASPQDAQNLIYMLSSGSSNLYLTLRHPSDRSPVKLLTSSVESVMNKVDGSMVADQVRQPASVAPPPPVAAPTPAPKPRRSSGFRNL